MYYTPEHGAEQSPPALVHGTSSWTDGRSVVGSSFDSKSAPLESQHTLRSLFHAKMNAKHERKARMLAISKYYNIVNPVDSEVRTHPHKRGSGIADDCHHFAFSEATLSLREPALCDDADDVGRSAPSRETTVYSESDDEDETCGDGFAIASKIAERGSLLLEVIAAEVERGEDCLNGKWAPNLQALTNWSGPGAREGSLLSWMLAGGDEPAKLLCLCSAAERILKRQPVVSEVEAPAKIFGDIHGQFRDLLLLFHFYGKPGKEEATDEMPVSFLFNGDFVDRGRHQLEVITLLLAYKVVYPDVVWLNRGNHEDQSQNFKTTQQGNIGFNRACEEELGTHVGAQIFRAFHSVFAWLPLAARVNQHILVLHGGLGTGKWTLEQLNNVERPIPSESLVTALDGVVYNILWSDPVQHTADDRIQPQAVFGVHRSHRAKHTDIMKVFGRDVTERFCRREKLSLIVRSHQFKNPCKGYELLHDGWLMRVFSARNYLGRIPNDSALLLVGRSQESPETLLVRPQVLERLHRQVTLESIHGDAEPYCPQGHLMQLERPKMPKCSIREVLAPVFGVPEDDNVECKRCGAEELQKTSCFFCRGCGTKPEAAYHMCLACADAIRGGAATSFVFLDDSDDESIQHQVVADDLVDSGDPDRGSSSQEAVGDDASVEDRLRQGGSEGLGAAAGTDNSDRRSLLQEGGASPPEDAATL